jgi:hypothetical protein
VRFRAAIAALLSFTLVTETTLSARAADTEREDTASTTPSEETVARLTPFWAVAPPHEVDVGARLALAGPLADGVMPFGTTPKAIMSNNTKTVLIVAIIAGAVLLVVGVIVIGKPFGKKP